MDLLKVSLNQNEVFTNSSEKISIKGGKKYSVKTIVQGIKGKLNCGYFGVIIFNNKDEEIARKIRWLNDFSGKQITYNIVFSIPKDAAYLTMIYRINEEIPEKSDCEYYILPPESLKLEDASDYEIEDFQVPENYEIPLTAELSPDEENTLEQNLVWIFGAPRSGTTWLATQLLSYNTKSINEPLIGMHLGSILYRSAKQERIKDVFQNESDYFFSNNFKQTWKHYTRKLILNRIYSQFPQSSSKIIIKEPNGAIGTDIISECLPNSKLIIILRDGRDVIDSIIDSELRDAWASKQYNLITITDDNRLQEIENLSKFWIIITTLLLKAFDNHQKKYCLMIKYEDLLENTFENLKKIYEFLNINIDDKKLNEIVDKASFSNIPSDQKGSGHVTRSATPGKWKENFNEKEKELMHKIMKDTLVKINYS